MDVMDAMNIIDADPRVRIKMAAEWLDREYEGWATRIDLENFEMSDSSRCIGAYLHIDWEQLRKGYEHDTETLAPGLFSWFTDEWRDEIEWRGGAPLT